MTKKNYLEPEVKIIALHLEGSVLSGSTLIDDLSGEDIKFGDEFDPWK